MQLWGQQDIGEVKVAEFFDLNSTHFTDDSEFEKHKTIDEDDLKFKD